MSYLNEVINQLGYIVSDSSDINKLIVEYLQFDIRGVAKICPESRRLVRILDVGSANLHMIDKYNLLIAHDRSLNGDFINLFRYNLNTLINTNVLCYIGTYQLNNLKNIHYTPYIFEYGDVVYLYCDRRATGEKDGILINLFDVFDEEVIQYIYDGKNTKRVDGKCPCCIKKFISKYLERFSFIYTADECKYSLVRCPEYSSVLYFHGNQIYYIDYTQKGKKHFTNISSIEIGQFITGCFTPKKLTEDTPQIGKKRIMGILDNRIILQDKTDNTTYDIGLDDLKLDGTKGSTENPTITLGKIIVGSMAIYQQDSQLLNVMSLPIYQDGFSNTLKIDKKNIKIAVAVGQNKDLIFIYRKFYNYMEGEYSLDRIIII